MAKKFMATILIIIFTITILACVYVLLFQKSTNEDAIATVIVALTIALFSTVFLDSFKELSLGPLKATMNGLDQKIDDQAQIVNDQAQVINAVTTVIEFGVTTRFEYDKLKGLERDEPFMCHYHENLAAEMKRLYDRGFVAETEYGRGPHIEDKRNTKEEFDLKYYYRLTNAGKTYLKCRREWRKYRQKNSGITTISSNTEDNQFKNKKA